MQRKTLLSIFIMLSAYSFAQVSSDSLQCTILKSEFIYEAAPFPSCHASTLVETEEGLLVAWFGGTHEKHPDVCIYGSALINGKWSNPLQLADGIINASRRHPCWNPVLFRRENGDVILYYKVGRSPSQWWGMFKISDDNGTSWSSAQRIPGKLLGPIKNKPQLLNDGSILYPTSFETNAKWRVYVETSAQDLTQWNKTEIDNNGFNAIQPTILTYKDGSIQLLCRSQEKKITETWSHDQGKTWTLMQATELPNNNAGIDGLTLRSGIQLLVCNPIVEGRNKLALLASADGKKWRSLVILEDKYEGEFSYPAIIQDRNGTIHITYTYNREKIRHVSLKIYNDQNREVL